MLEDRGLLLVFISTCILGWMPIAINGVTDPTDAAALKAMFSGMNSPSQLGWPANGDDPCGQSWKGITCSDSRVTEIKLPNLGLSGSLGYQLQTMTSVTNLDMSSNNFEGGIPYQLPENLQQLNLANNRFTGNIPYSIAEMTSLTYLNLGHNQLQNGLDNIFQKLSSLSTLDLSFNSLSGNLPQSFSSLSSMTNMYLQNNQFTGTIDVLANLPLEKLNLENNHFTGWIPEQLKNINLQKEGNTWSTGPAPPPPPGTPPASRSNRNHKSGGSNSPSDAGTSEGGKKSGIGGGGIAGIVISIVVVGAIVAFFLVKRKSRKSSSDIEKLDNQPFAPLTSNEVHEVKSVQTPSVVDMKTFDSSASINLKPPPIDRHKSFDEDEFSKKPIAVKKTVKAPANVKSYSIADLQIATGSFSVDHLLGEGSFGRVYRAQFDDGKVLAVKKIDSSVLPYDLSEEFTGIVSNISHLHHPNVTELVGYCSEHGQHLLIYEFHKNGSLHDFLHLPDEYSKPLIWNSRVKIALGTARALEYLHEVCSPSVVHKNIKSANILLDAELNPHLSDSGLAGYIPNADQKGNVANQREHLILLLANIDIRNKTFESHELHEATVPQLMGKMFKNYNSWCDYVHCESNLRFPEDHNMQQLALIYMALYLLIWGEASNIRFMPECLCYIFHHMCNDVDKILHSNVHLESGDTYKAATRDEEYFLRDVITPIYEVLAKEAKRNNKGKASHSQWRNYDDLNEYFWSDRCFKLGWPMNPKADFFRHSDEMLPGNEGPNQASSGAGKKKPKTNFVEVRTFLHLYRSFDRMWIFFILALQAMVIVAWSSMGPLAMFFDEDVFRSVMSIFITYAFLNFLQVTLDIFLTRNAWQNMKFTQLLRYLLKFAVAAVWVVVLPVSYSSSLQNPSGLVKFFTSWAGDWGNQSLYSYVVAIYLLPNIVAAILFFLPPLRRKLERSNMQIITLLMWWAQPKLYVGRGMHENMLSLLNYTLFWIMLLISKLAFSYYVEISPLVGPTKLIMEMPVNSYQWHEFFPENETHNICIVIAIWAPIILVYFMDTQIWYAIFSTVVGGIVGAFSHLGEIRTLGMLRSRFESIPSAFSQCFLPGRNNETIPEDLDESYERRNIAYFSQVWNEFINSMRDEDLISNRDRDLLLVPYRSSDISVIQWPPFLLASKIPIALDMAKDYKGKDDADLFKKIKSDEYMYSAAFEYYETLRDIIYHLLLDEEDKEVVRHICYKVEMSIRQHTFVKEFKMSGLPSLSEKLENFLTLLRSDDDKVESLKPQIVNVLQDIVEIIIQDVMVDGHLILQAPQHYNVGDDKKGQRFANIDTSLTLDKSWKEKVIRLHLLLTVKESAINVPPNLDARRRITFFANSLFMNMPRAPKVQDMLSFSVLTPYYKEDVLYSDEELNKENEDGISILFYLKKIYPDEWTNFHERIKELKDYYPEEIDEGDLIRQWASYRGQTLHRTVRGMMYYRQALNLQCFLEYAGDNAIFGGYRTVNFSETDKRVHLDRAQALADLKFTYVVSCQIYGSQKKSKNARDRSCYNNILNLMLTYSALRVAYIDEQEETVGGKSQKFYYSVLVKGGDKYDEEIYRIKLPGSPTEIGEGKPENQNHAIIFTRGEALQTIDMNQDNYYEEAFKMRNVLEEFHRTHSGERKPTILGLREHIFTGSVSSLAWFMSNQETSFVTIGQRILANPLRVRFHYGHPDIFDRIFHITRGGISKASRVINLSEDIFAGFNSTLRGGFVTHHEYIQVGKGRDVGLNQISLFEAKVANGNGEQTLSRDVYRLGRQFDFYRMFSFYFTTVGFYFSSMVPVLTVYVFLYGRLYMVLSGVEREIIQSPNIHQSQALEEALATQSVFQLGLLLVLPMVMETGLEKGFRTALGDFIIMQLQLASVFFTFQLGTKAHYYGRTLLHGGSKYRSTGRGFVVFHAKFADNYRMYSRSHFVKGLEILILLIVYEVYGESYRSSNLYLFITFSMWFLATSWLFAPFLFNPSGFDWQKTVDDWTDWKRWMGNRGGIGIPPDKGWESWWDEENEHLKHSHIRGKVLEIILAFRFFMYQYGIVYHLDIAHHNKSLLVFSLSWAVLVTILIVLKMVSMGRRRFGTDFQLMFRILKALLFLGFMSVMTVLFVVCGLTISDLFAAILAFMPSGWALILIAQPCRGLLKRARLWDSVKELSRAYEYIMGLIIFMPIAVLSWFPFVSEFQTRLLFNQAFSRGLQISMILAGKDTDKSD